MKTIPFLIQILAAAAFLLSGTTRLPAQGTTFTYQGRLIENGVPANGNYNLTFTLFNVNAGGSAVAGPITNALVVNNGLFTVTLNFGAGIFNGASYWLQIAAQSNGLAGFTTLTPRQVLTPTPYAIYAGGASAAGLSGTIPGGSLGGLYGNAVNFNNSTNSFTGSGAGLTGVNALTLGGLGADQFWKLLGNGGTTAGLNFLGTTDDEPLELKVNGRRAFRLEPKLESPNIIGGFSGNYATTNVEGATIAGGGRPSGAIYTNWVSANFGTVGGGEGNGSGGWGATVGGGSLNYALDFAATVSGGYHSFANGERSTVGGGYENYASGSGSTIGGGQQNTASGDYSTVGGGGTYNIATGNYSTIGGGTQNNAGGNSSTVGGGFFNVSSGDNATISGGADNTATNQYATVAGGVGNLSGGSSTFVGGGSANTALSGYSAVAGGSENLIFISSYGVIAGGHSNILGADFGGGADLSAIGGGRGNLIFQEHATIAGGLNNQISQSQTLRGDGATIGGGRGNLVFAGERCTIGGGESNTIYTTCGGATIGGGVNNYNQGLCATIGGGFNNGIGGGCYDGFGNDVSTIGGGGYNVIGFFGRYSTIAGGFYNSILFSSFSYGGTVGGGISNAVTAAYGTIPGGTDAKASSYGQMAYASGQFAGQGDAQTSVYVCRGITSNTTQTNLFLDGISERLVVPTNSTWCFDIIVTGRASDGTSAAYHLLGEIKNNGGTITLGAAVTKTNLAEDIASWDATVVPDDINDALVVRVNGSANLTVRWVASVRTVEVTY